MAKDVVKGIKRRLQHKNPRVQLLTLTLLETMVKNCGEYIRHQIVDRKVLDEMIKVVKKKGDLRVREKILILMDSWQEAFGGPGGRYSQYYCACEELRRFGARFPRRSVSVTKPHATPEPMVPHIGHETSSNSSRRLDEAMASEVEGLSSSTLKSMRNALELLDDMLQAVNHNDRMSVKDEVIVDLVDHCRTKQKQLMQMITTTTDEDLLAQGLKINDSLQSVLAKHDTIESSAPLVGHGRCNNVKQIDSIEADTKIRESRDKRLMANGNSPVSGRPDDTEQVGDEDESALLIPRNSKTQSGPSQIDTSGAVEDGASSSGSNSILALIDVDAPPPETTTTASKEQDLIDLLSIVLTTSSTPETPTVVLGSVPAQRTFEMACDSYVAPWAQAQARAQPQQQPQQMMQSIPRLQRQYQLPMQPQGHQLYSQPASTNPPPPWEATSSYGNIQNLGSNLHPHMYPNYQGSTNSGSVPIQGGAWSSQKVNAFQYSQYGNQAVYPSPQLAVNGSLQHSNSFQKPSSTNCTLNRTTSGDAFDITGQKPFGPSDRLFGDLNGIGSSDGKLRNAP